MTQPSAFKGTYSDWKLVKTRGVVQVIFEVPLADADAAYSILGGMPNAANETWFGIAALNIGAPQQPAAPVEKERMKWSELSPTVQAGIRCNEPVFQAFLREDCNRDDVIDDKTAATAVRTICGVNSRASLATNMEAAAKWGDLDNQFGAWKMAEQLA